jgi:ATP-dependent exoDNAse (exonuclease V) alpha subunit
LTITDTLGADVDVKTERGERQFASGDRIMFLRNERGMGVKNGTLGTIESVSSGHMAVPTDDGRSVAFDLNDYAHVDHGYAATFHKSQGVGAAPNRRCGGAGAGVWLAGG